MPKKEIHESHDMGKPQSEILAPAGTPRFYSVRKCKKCGYGTADHPAGHFVDQELYEPCFEVE